MQEWFKLYTTKNYLEANIIKGLLEENNITAVVLNMQDSSYLAFGDIEIYVPVYLKQMALNLLNDVPLN